jgi:hypothetical protein
MREKLIYIVDYAYGFHANTCEVDEVCELRTAAALRALKKYPDAHIVLSAGMSEATGDCGPLADMMMHFLVLKNVPKEKILKNPYGRDTLSETEAAFEIMKHYGLGKVICATSRFHATRVFCIWFFRFGVMPRVFTSQLEPPQSQYWHELLKIPRDIVRSLLHRLSSSRLK